MEIKKTMESELNRQMNREFYSSFLYLSMAAYVESLNLRGMAKWLRLQAGEEMKHGMKFYDFIFERGGAAKIDSMPKMPTSWKSPLDAFRAAYEHEQKVTAWIHDIYGKAEAQKDHATKVFLNWFVDEQVEEEDQTREIVNNLKMIKDSKSALFMYDKALGERKGD
jgi:ferritin